MIAVRRPPHRAARRDSGSQAQNALQCSA
jgi:hypothetical protein